jgi:hypothetical protein
LTPDRLADVGENLSCYQVVPQTTHTILAQASLSVLLTVNVSSYICEIDLPAPAHCYWFPRPWFKFS